MPPLPQKAVHIEENPILVHDYNQNQLMYIGSKKTWILKGKKWEFHSQFERRDRFAVLMPNGIYLFNKMVYNAACKTEFRFLPPNGKSWTICYAKFQKPHPMDRFTCGLAISSTEFVLLRDFNPYGFKTSLIKCNTGDGICTEMGNLQDNRRKYTAIVFNGKIIISGGYNMIDIEGIYYEELAKSTEIIPLEVSQKSKIKGKPISRKVGNINFPRKNPSMGIVKVDGKSKVILFGGGEPVEEWDDEEEIWRVSQNFSFTKRIDYFAHC